MKKKKELLALEESVDDKDIHMSTCKHHEVTSMKEECCLFSLEWILLFLKQFEKKRKNSFNITLNY